MMRLARVVGVVKECSKGGAGGAGEALLGVVAQHWGGAFVVPLSKRHQGSNNAYHCGITAEMSQTTAMKTATPQMMPIATKGFE